MKKHLHLAVIIAIFSVTASNADIFGWGVGKLKDGFDEIKSNVKKIVGLVEADGKDYGELLEFKYTTFTVDDEVSCKSRVIASDDDLKVTDARHCVIISNGSVEIDNAVDSIIIAQGSITNKWRDSQISNSLVASRSKIKFNGKIHNSTIYARSGAKIDRAEKLTTYATPDTQVNNLADKIKALEGKELL